MQFRSPMWVTGTQSGHHLLPARVCVSRKLEGKGSSPDSGLSDGPDVGGRRPKLVA